jgi:SP family arabinose:H+ symporter-like MFS transporter
MMKIIFWSATVALAGFLFGFDTVVISGADKKLQALWGSSDTFHGFVVISMALWGTVIGAIFGGIPTNKFGRKNTLIGIGILFFVSAIGSALVSDPYLFSMFRLLGGLGVGASTIAAPAYISEIAPAKSRGWLVATYQLSIVLGVLGAFVSNYLFKDFGENAWRWMIGIEAVPAIFYGVAILFVPKSPRWLAIKGREQEAIKTLATISPNVSVEEFAKQVNSEDVKNHENIFMKKYRPALFLVFFIAFFNQFSGINAFMYYGSRIFEEAGLAKNAALLSSIGIGAVNLLFTIIGMILIDRLGRKRMMYIGSVGYIVSLSLVAIAFFNGWQGFTIPIFFFLFIASHAIGQGTVIWVFISELFPTHLRATGQAFGCSVHWILAALIPSFIPLLISSIGAGTVFAIFAFMMVGQFIWVKLKMPETKGKTLEEISSELTKSTLKLNNEVID